MTDRPINILYFSNQPVRGGVEEHMLMLMQGLDRRRFRPHLVCSPEVLGELLLDVPPDVVVTPLYFEHFSQLSAAGRFAGVLRKYRIDILHSHLFRASLAGSPVARLCGVPVIIETPHIRESWRTGWLKGHFVVDRCVGQFVDRYIAVSEANARYLSDTKGLHPEKIHVVPNGCALTRFRPDHRPPAGLRRTLGIAENDPIILALARLEEQKGHRVLIEAMRTIVREFPAAKLVCVGEGSLRAKLEAQTRQAGLASQVRFVGYQSNTPDWLALADVVALPSFFEGLPLVAIESLAAGRAMAATAVDGTPEVVVHETTGLTVPPGDSAALAAAICRLLGQPALREKLGENGRRLVLEKFGKERFLDRTQEVYLAAWEQHLHRRGARHSMSVAPEATPSAQKGTL